MKEFERESYTFEERYEQEKSELVNGKDKRRFKRSQERMLKGKRKYGF